MTGLRVVVAADDVPLREGLSSLLDRDGFDVVGQAAMPHGFSSWSERPPLTW